MNDTVKEIFDFFTLLTYAASTLILLGLACVSVIGLAYSCFLAYTNLGGGVDFFSVKGAYLWLKYLVSDEVVLLFFGVMVANIVNFHRANSSRIAQEALNIQKDRFSLEKLLLEEEASRVRSARRPPLICSELYRSPREKSD